jgi:cytochrome c-type biogenesis protein
LDIFQIGVAFTAGVLAVLSPCAIPMLPAYIAVRLRDNKHSVAQGMAYSFFMIIGFMTVYVLLGFIPSLLISTAFSNSSYTSPVIGIVLIVLGLTSWFTHLFDKIPKVMLQAPGGVGAWGMILFGIAYGTSSLGCSLPVFLVVVLGAAATEGFNGVLTLYIAYGAGVASLILPLTLMISFAEGFFDERLTSVMPHIRKVSSVLIVLAGIYMLVKGLGV